MNPDAHTLWHAPRWALALLRPFSVDTYLPAFSGIAPAVAPLLGGVLFVHLGWYSIFWLLAVRGLLLTAATWRAMPETLHPSHAKPFNLRHLMRGYWELGRDPRLIALALASGIPFNGMFLYVLSVPTFLGDGSAS